MECCVEVRRAGSIAWRVALRQASTLSGLKLCVGRVLFGHGFVALQKSPRGIFNTPAGFFLVRLAMTKNPSAEPIISILTEY